LDDDLVGQTFPLDTPLFQEIKSTQRSIIIDDATRDPRFNGWGGTDKIRGWMGVPLLIKGELIGYITFDSYQPHAYGFSEAELAEPFAAQAAQAIENARLYEEVQRYAQELEQRVLERTAELQKMVNLMAGREVRMAELKDAVKILRAQLKREGIEPAADDPLLDHYALEQESSG
jgi:GAF domain-containing protein